MDYTELEAVATAAGVLDTEGDELISAGDVAACLGLFVFIVCTSITAGMLA